MLQRIQPGMLVAYKLPPLEAKGGAAHKLQARYSEPWRVTKQLGNSVTYEIRHLIRGEVKLVNRDRLIVFKPRSGSINVEGAAALPQYQPESWEDEEDEPQLTSEAQPEASVSSEPIIRTLRAMTECRARLGNPMSWQYRNPEQS